MKSRGIITVAFGKEYDKIAAHTAEITRRHTNLPICVVTNLMTNERHEKWEEVLNVSFVYLHWSQSGNRKAKLQLQRFTPFEDNIYIDADALVQLPHVEKLFDCLSSCSIGVQHYMDVTKTEKTVKICRTHMRKCGIEPPMHVYCGGFFVWRNSNSIITNGLFPLWYRNWVLTGRGREMFAFSCAIKRLELNIRHFVPKDDVFAPNYPLPNCLIQHNYNTQRRKDFFKDFGLPRYLEYKPFDGKRKDDWTWVHFDE